MENDAVIHIDLENDTVLISGRNRGAVIRATKNYTKLMLALAIITGDNASIRYWADAYRDVRHARFVHRWRKLRRRKGE